MHAKDVEYERFQNDLIAAFKIDQADIRGNDLLNRISTELRERKE